MTNQLSLPRSLAVMGGAYGNLAALGSCLDDASNAGAERKAFIGDSIGCCGHSNEIVKMIREGFDIFVAGNHEQQAVAGSKTCGCGYSSAEDEKISCESFELATAGLDDQSRAILATWPELTSSGCETIDGALVTVGSENGQNIEPASAEPPEIPRADPALWRSIPTDPHN